MVDIKLGKRTYDLDASEKKKLSMIRKELSSTSSTLGFRISGMKIWNPLEKNYQFWKKSDCKILSCNKESIQSGFDHYFYFLDLSSKLFLKNYIINSILALKDALHSIKAALFSCSLLIVFDFPSSSRTRKK